MLINLIIAVEAIERDAAALHSAYVHAGVWRRAVRRVLVAGAGAGRRGARRRDRLRRRRRTTGRAGQPAQW